MVKYDDLKKIAEIRLREAKSLRRSRLYDGAAYICGYVVETALKARICKHLGLKEYPDDGKDKQIFSSHDFDRLLLLSGLQNRISLGNSKTRKLFENWSLLTSWKPERRYTIGLYKKKDVDELIKALEDGPSGFFNWIQKLW